MNKTMKQEPTPAEVRGKVGFYLEIIKARKQDIASYEEKIIGLQHSCPHKNTSNLTEDQSFLASGTIVSGAKRCQDCGALLNANNEVVPEPEENGK